MRRRNLTQRQGARWTAAGEARGRKAKDLYGSAAEPHAVSDLDFPYPQANSGFGHASKIKQHCGDILLFVLPFSFGCRAGFPALAGPLNQVPAFRRGNVLCIFIHMFSVSQL